MVKLIKKSIVKVAQYHDYIIVVAYGIVLADVLELAKEVVTEWLIHKRFNQLVQRHVEETSEIKETYAEMVARDENSAKSDTFFNEVENVTSTEVNVTNSEN